MSKRTLESLKAAFATPAQQEGDRPKFANNYYPFFSMELGQRAVIRFLPDTDDNNPRGFLVEKVFHNLMINGQKKTVPCLTMYGEDCPICKVSSEYYKAEGKESPNGKKYWRKKQYLAQALIVEDPLPADKVTNETHLGKVRVVALGWQIYGIIKEAMGGEDLDAIPFDFEEGYDFIIKKTEQGKYATYTMGTKFAGKQRGLTEAELAVVEAGSIELATLLPKNPGLEKVQAMLNADLNGEAYEGDTPTDDTPEEGATKAAPKETKVAAAKAEAAPAKTVQAEQAADGAMTDVDAMLEQIRARRNAAKS